MENQLSPKQMQVLAWIEQYLAQNHTMPSRREIAEGVGVSSPATIQQHIEALEKKGYLKRGESRESRALQWTAKSKKLNQTKKSSQKKTEQEEHSWLAAHGNYTVPLLGSIAAGYPIEVYPDARPMNVPIELFISPQQAARYQKDIYMLTVRGDSMIDEGIMPGDWVLLRKSTQAKTGDTVAALLNGEATLKKFSKTASKLELHPANPKYPVISIHEEDRFEIQGILIGVIRRFT